MKFKDRFDLLNNAEDIQNYDDDLIKVKNDTDILDIFEYTEQVHNIITSAVCRYENIIVASGVDCDKTIISQYMKSYLPQNDSVDIIYNVNKDIQYVNAQRIMIPDADIVSFVKILEYILYGYSNFIIGLNIKSYENILESLKTLIALYYSNLTEMNINNLIGTSRALLVYISKNEDGLFCIRNIGQIEYSNNDLNLIDLYKYQDNEAVQNVNTDNDNEKMNETSILIQAEKQPAAEDKSIIEIVENTPQYELTETSSVEIKDVSEKRINKYKLLREKLKNKRINSKEE